MNRRTFIASSAGVAAAIASSSRSLARQATPGLTDLPLLEITITDTGFVVPETVAAGRTLFSVTNTGTMAESHWLMAKLPDSATEEEVEEFFASDGEGGGINFDTDLWFVGVPDWPAPDGPAVTGIVDLTAGRYFLMDPITGARSVARTLVEGETGSDADPVADLTVTLQEMTIDLPEAAFTSSAMRWRIDNIGSFPHDVAVIPVSGDFTEEHFETLLSLPDGATPPGVPPFEYLPLAAIGVLSGGGTSWLDVQFAPGRYVALCALPFGTGYPHVMDGMYVFFDVT